MLAEPENLASESKTNSVGGDVGGRAQTNSGGFGESGKRGSSSSSSRPSDDLGGVWLSNHLSDPAAAAAADAADKERERRRVQFGLALQATNMGLYEVAPDGACMFRALSVHLYGDDQFHAIVRDACLEYMQIRRAHFAPFVDDGEGTFGEYMLRMAAHGSWGGQHELQAACQLYGRAVVLHVYDQVSGVRQQTLNEQAKGGDLTAFDLSYFSGNHYDAAVPCARMIMGEGGGRRRNGSV